MVKQKRPEPDKIIAYKGKKFTIEWYHDAKGKSQGLEYADELDRADRKKLTLLLTAMGDVGYIRNEQKFRYEGDKIYAFKPKPHRFLSFFFTDGKIIITNAFTKKQDKLPESEKERALKHKADYEERVKAGSYYEKE